MNIEVTPTAIPITISYGDGIGPEIMEATLLILRESAANIVVESLEVGERIYNMKGTYGILPSAWDMLKRNKIYLKAPITIPDVADLKDVNLLIYNKFGLTSDNLLITNMMNIPDSDWLAGSANIGEDFAIFEPIHDSAPEIAGKNIANPSGMIQSAIMLLEHIGQGDVAEIIKNAWLKTLEDGIHTADIYRRRTSKKKVGTMEFSEEVIERMGKK